ncbi:exonuclease domain-containing protein [Fictibacillus iocasae]|uniref:Exonuclease domain-containing protein n=1 Tax=Fictibacillus iocasae TaxID=2715437 RepID=A0ABW2NNF9_9BACL
MKHPSNDSGTVKQWINQLLSLGIKRDQVPGGVQSDFSRQAWIRAVMKENAKKKKEQNLLLCEMPVIIIDSETTGFRPEHGDEMISLCAIKLEGKNEEKRLSTFIKAEKKIPEDVKRLTGITDNDLLDAPPLIEIMPDLVPLLSSHLIVGYHISHDLTFLNHHLWKSVKRKLSNPSLDLKMILEKMYRGRDFSTFDDALSFFSLEIKDRHTAAGDAEAAVKLWECILSECDTRSVKTLNDFHRLLV